MNKLLTTLTVGAVAVSSANAQTFCGKTEIDITANITTSTTWTADNVYNLTQQIYVLPGATLTIEAGTLVASDTNVGGSLAVSRGAQIFILGENGAPVIMTSKADVATWSGNCDARTGVWREAANEWGNLTVMGDAYISENAIAANTPFPSAGNFANMEGLVPPPGQTWAQYGGGNDNDDSGVINYLSLRYGGRVVGLNNELNGLSLGGIGRGTDIDFVEVMNNVDDGVEVWGGTVDLKHLSIWNIGDDSLDIDQGWRGLCQFLLIVQGYSLDASQGSGVGDNACETDGAEDSFYQPRTRAQVVNATVIGQPLDGDGLTAWRDNAGLQYTHSIFMDGGEQVIRFDNDDGDGAQGYGAMGTEPWEQHWTTGANTFPIVNAPGNPAAFYQSQAPGKNVIDFEDNVFFNNNASSAYTEAIARGVFNPSNNNVVTMNSPIASIVRAPEVQRGGRRMVRVISLDPEATNDAADAAVPVQPIGSLDSVDYRGAFSPDTEGSWLCGWSASSAFGFVDDDCIGAGYGLQDTNPNSTGLKGKIAAWGSTSVSDNDLTIEARDLPRNAFGFALNAPDRGLLINPGGSSGNILLGGPVGRFQQAVASSGPEGIITLDVDVTMIPRPSPQFVAIQPGETWRFQFWHRDSAGGSATSNFTSAVEVTFD
ncbi:MAG: hypothetical protein AAF726_24530 [Planctomycetota bacterium]